MYPVVIICVIQWSFWITIILCKFWPNINVKIDVLFFSHICREIVNVCCTSVLGFIYLNSSIFLKYVTHVYICVWKVFSLSGVIRTHKSKEDRKYNDQTDKQWFTKHYTENYRMNNTNPLKTGRELMCFGMVSSSWCSFA
jgi:general stress protein CsbA